MTHLYLIPASLLEFEEYTARHVKTVGGVGASSARMCLLCGKTLSQMSSLSRHFSDRHCEGAPGFVCPLCHKRYKSKNSLSKHIYIYHPGTSVKGVNFETLRENIVQPTGQLDLIRHDEEAATADDS